MTALLIRDTDDPLKAVLTHLRELLNTRQGSVPGLPHYGLPDSNDLLRSGAPPGRQLCQSIRDCINAWEPRVQIDDIQEQPDPDDPARLHVLIRARLLQSDNSLLWLETSLDMGGHVTVDCRD